VGWLVDTNVWVAIERGKIAAADIYAITRQEAVYISPVNIAEMQFGLEMLAAGAARQRAATALRRLRRKPQLRITSETGEVFGILAAKLRKAGRDANFRINDLWLAAQAVQRSFTLLTANPKDFADVPRLKMVTFQLS
jgi:predicted nucleic acid-binding protein